MVPVVSPEVWGRYAQAILRLCEDVGAGDPGDPDQEETRSWLDGYLIERYVRDEKEWEEVARDWDNAAQRQVPFLKRGLIRIFREDFIEWLGKKLDKRLGLHERGRRLRLVEAEPGRGQRARRGLPDPPDPPDQPVCMETARHLPTPTAGRGGARGRSRGGAGLRTEKHLSSITRAKNAKPFAKSARYSPTHPPKGVPCQRRRRNDPPPPE